METLVGVAGAVVVTAVVTLAVVDATVVATVVAGADVVAADDVVATDDVVIFSVVAASVVFCTSVTTVVTSDIEVTLDVGALTLTTDIVDINDGATVVPSLSFPTFSSESHPTINTTHKTKTRIMNSPKNLFIVTPLLRI